MKRSFDRSQVEHSFHYYALSPWEFQKRFLEEKRSYAV